MFNFRGGGYHFHHDKMIFGLSPTGKTLPCVVPPGVSPPAGMSQCSDNKDLTKPDRNSVVMSCVLPKMIFDPGVGSPVIQRNMFASAWACIFFPLVIHRNIYLYVLFISISSNLYILNTHIYHPYTPCIVF